MHAHYFGNNVVFFRIGDRLDSFTKPLQRQRFFAHRIIGAMSLKTMPAPGLSLRLIPPCCSAGTTCRDRPR